MERMQGVAGVGSDLRFMLGEVDHGRVLSVGRVRLTPFSRRVWPQDRL